MSNGYVARMMKAIGAAKTNTAAGYAKTNNSGNTYPQSILYISSFSFE